MPILTLADNLNRLRGANVVFSDISTNFDMAPHSGDLALVTNDDAVAQALENLILTVVKERPYDYSIGSEIQFRAFELASEVERELIKAAIISCAEQNEPRVNIIDVEVDLSPDTNQYAVAIVYNVINIKQVQTLQVIIKRTR